MAIASPRGKSVMVTGGAGFVGSHLCDKLLALRPSRLSIVDDFSLGSMRNISQLTSNSHVSVWRQDASDLDEMKRIMTKEETEVVFNLAVIPLPKSLVHPKETVDKNILITTTICELQRREAFKRLVHCSSSEIYGSASFLTMNEDHPARPITPYAASKIACDQIVLSYDKTFGTDTVIARPFNSYGPRQNQGSYAGVIPITIKRILNGMPPVIHGDGRQSRDFTYVDDTAEGILKVYQRPAARGLAVNIASGREVTIGNLIRTISRLMGYRGTVERLPERAGDVRRHRGDIKLARKLLGYSPKTSLIDGLKKTIDWYRANP